MPDVTQDDESLILVEETIDAMKGGTIKTSVKLDSTVKEGETKIVVVGTSEIASTGFVMNSSRILEKSGKQSNVNSNGLFVRNIIDYLNGNEYIPEMKTKSLDFNPLEKTSNTSRLVYKSINIAGVPILIIIMGLFMWRKRSSRRKLIQKQFSGEVADE